MKLSKNLWSLLLRLNKFYDVELHHIIYVYVYMYMYNF